jgi:hypothetical protein
MPKEQKERVKVIDKRREIHEESENQPYILHFFTFEFPDGSRKDISIRTRVTPHEIFDFTVVNDMGILTFQEWESWTEFIRFERNNYAGKTRRSIYDKIYKTKSGYALVAVIITILFIAASIAISALFSLDILLVGSLSLLLILSVLFILWLVPYYKLKNMPVKKEHVKVLETREPYSNERGNNERISVFEFSDGSRKIFSFYLIDNNLPVVNDMGTLTYKEWGYAKKFFSFEKDN